MPYPTGPAKAVGTRRRSAVVAVVATESFIVIVVCYTLAQSNVMACGTFNLHVASFAGLRLSYSFVVRAGSELNLAVVKVQV
jgi:hypothetical protein